MIKAVSRLVKLITFPVKFVFAGLYPNSYARIIGVKAKGRFKVYGNSYYTFGAEPYLVTIGDNVHISRDVSFVCHDGASLIAVDEYPDIDVVAPIKIGDNVFIGLGALVLPGVTIGDNVIIGARSVVSDDVASGVVVAGSPAKIVGMSIDTIQRAIPKSTGLGQLSRKEREKHYQQLFESL